MTRFPRTSIGSTGLAVPALGFGAASVGNLYRAMSDAAARETLQCALDQGIALFDTAPHYGQGLSERRVGAVISGHDVVLSTKVGRVLKPTTPHDRGTERYGFIDGDPYEPEFDYSYDGVMRAFNDSRHRLGGAPVDILLAHDLGEVTHGDAHAHHLKAFLDGGYHAMRALKDGGQIRAIGLGVNEWQICEEILGHADIDVVLLAGRYTLLEQTALSSFLPLCERRGVSVLAAGVFNSGILSGGTAYNYAPAPETVRSRVQALKAVCDSHNVPLAAVALQFPLAHPAIAGAIVGMASPAEVTQNIDWFNRSIPAGLWSDLKAETLLPDDAPTPAPEKVHT
ncbi:MULTISPECIES: aldo/keto reductase [Asticcacaulis]|uniref:aldo/keto reductase n=1 Tax=Asticcacaulis TaxID=76890 RepID=UPI00285ABC54|nr:aldo/keto reductase [Asticcacaulis sp. BE141]MBP2159447.1 D-threo-aldose 1-dehydrogenase [Asticcacaulis solisilvae]MDR6800726.1 D-threo-aldose 1-dehydrogenase [Asticcacaulis sp. BE141]